MRSLVQPSSKVNKQRTSEATRPQHRAASCGGCSSAVPGAARAAASHSSLLPFSCRATSPSGRAFRVPSSSAPVFGKNHIKT